MFSISRSTLPQAITGRYYLKPFLNFLKPSWSSQAKLAKKSSYNLKLIENFFISIFANFLKSG